MSRRAWGGCSSSAMSLIATMPLMLASLEGLLFFLLIIGISALSNWLRQKQQQKQDGEAPPAEGEVGAPRRRGFDWEQELRRLIEGSRQQEQPPPQPPPVVRPVLVEEPDEMVPPLVEPTPVQRRREPPRPVSPKAPAAPATISASFKEEMAGRRESLHTRIGRLKASWAKRAEGVETSVARRTAGLKQVSGSGASPMSPMVFGGQRREASPAVRNVLATLRRPTSASEAIIAADILGQPKGLQT